MDAMELLPGASSEPHVYLETKRFEENLFAGPAGGPDPRADLFFWHGLLADDEVRIAVALPGLGEPMAQELRLIVHGASAHPEQPHRIELRWNGERLGVFDVFGRQRHTIRVPMDGVAAGLENELTVVHHRAGDAPPALYLDAVEVDYARLARADGPALWFGAGGQGHCTVTGLSAELAHLYDVSDPDRPQHYGEAPIDETGTLRFACDDPGRRFLVATTESVLAPSAVHAHHVMDLRSPRGGADYLIIAPSHLLADAQGLAEYREADGYRVLVVDVDDVFWAFADGEPDPIAIRDFLSFAVGQWDEPPRFVTLVGKGSFDYRDLQGLGGNWIPPMLAPTEGGLFPSDSMLGDLSGDDGVPEIAVGRLPISKGEELSAILASIERFEKGHTSMNALFASDDSEHEEFSAATDLLTKAMPPNRVEELDLNVETLEGARAQLFSLWQSPLSWLSYVGHGGLDRLADEGWLTSDDVPSLAALNSAPVLLGWSCNILRFDIPGYSSLGEKLVVQGASAGVFSATGWSNHVESDAFRAAFSEAAFTTEAETIGEAMLIAHKAAANARLPLHRVYMLLGDPALRLRPPRKPAESAPPSPEEPSDSVGLPRTADSSSDSSAGCEITSAGSARGPFDLVVLILCAIVWIRRGGRVSDRHRHLH